MQDARWTTHAGSGTRHAGMRKRPCSRFAIAWLLAAIPAIPAMAVEPAETVVQVHPTAVVNGEQVTLSQIAALQGSGAELVGEWAIIAAPAAGRETTIDQNAIQQALIRRGINPSLWVFRGAIQCRISRPANLPKNTQADRDGAEPSVQPPSLAATVPHVASAPAEPAGPDPDTLEGVIHTYMASRLASLGGRPSIQVGPSARDLLRLSRPTYEFGIVDRGERTLGLVSLDVTISRNGKIEQTRPVLMEVSLAKPVVVAAAPINRGQTIGPEHVVLKEQLFDRADRIGPSDLKAFIGQRAVRFINRNEFLATKDVEPVPFVLRNELVTVTIRRGGVTLKGVAKAMQAASYGQTVELRNEASKETFTATVTGPRTAELVVSPLSGVQALSMAGGTH